MGGNSADGTIGTIGCATVNGTCGAMCNGWCCCVVVLHLVLPLLKMMVTAQLLLHQNCTFSERRAKDQ
jgi:hypothetical protein